MISNLRLNTFYDALASAHEWRCGILDLSDEEPDNERDDVSRKPRTRKSPHSLANFFSLPSFFLYSPKTT